MKLVKVVGMIAGLTLLSACAGVGPKVDPLSYQVTPADSEKIDIPAVCKSSYKNSTPRVAVVSFTNNSTYSDMTATNTNVSANAKANRKAHGAAAAKAAPGAVSVGYVSGSTTSIAASAQMNTFNRQIKANIGEYAQAAVESTLSGIGGIQLYNRRSLGKILSEQKFQATVADPGTAVKLGKMAGVDYIITGTVDNIAVKYFDKVDTNNNASGNLGAFLSIAAIAINTQTGWNVNVEMSVSMIDVSTGQVIVNKKVTGRENAGSAPTFSPENAISAAKKALGKAVMDIRPEFSEKFAQKGYIQQLRGSKKVALINIGTQDGVKSGDKLDIYDFSTVTDPFTNATTCNMSKIPVTLIISDQIQPTQSWVSIDGKDDVLARVKIGSIIMTQKQEGQSFMNKLF